MERFIRVTKAKLVVMSLATLLPLLIVLIMTPVLKEFFKPYYDILTLRYLLFVVVEAVIVWKIIRYARILKSNEYANRCLVALRDERNVFVKMKSCQLSLKIILFTLSIVTVAFGFIDREIFYTLLAVLAVIVISQLSTAIYYHKKY